MSTYSVGVIGAGIIAREAHLPVLACMPDVSVRWICDANFNRATALGKATGIPAVNCRSPDDLPPSNVALMAIPVGVRGAYLELFARRGTAVLTEKPFSLSAAEHRNLIDQFAPGRLACGYMRRFYTSTLLMQQLVATRPFGRLLRIRISEGSRATGSRVDQSYLDDSRQSARGGILSELGCHSLDVALFITGARSAQIEACQFALDGNVDRKVAARLALTDSDANEQPVQLDFCVSWLDPQSNTITLEFEHCVVWTGVKPGADVFMGDPSRPSAATRLVPAVRGAVTANQAFYLQWRSFIDGVRAGTDSTVSARSALLGTTLVENLYRHGRPNA